MPRIEVHTKRVISIVGAAELIDITQEFFDREDRYMLERVVRDSGLIVG